MSDWTDGYVSEIEYTYGYYVELNPLRLAMPFLNVGLAPPRVEAACELAFGQGVTVNIHAASSDVRWYGTDFNPAHAGFAQSLAAAAGSGAQLFDEPFAEFCARPDLPCFDYIALHGIYSWVSDENQRIIADFLRRKLKPGGVAYISYNVLPGFAAALPLQHLLAQHADVMSVPGNGLLARLDAALGFVDNLLAVSPIVAAAYPTIGDRLRTIKGQNRNYVAHEYFNRHWRPVHFSQIAEHLAAVRLTFACSATYLDHIDALNLTGDQQHLLGQITDPVFRQTVRDFIINQQFRRDYWVKGARRLPPLEQAEAVRRLRVMLTQAPNEVSYTVNGALGPREMAASIYGPVVDLLADYQIKTIGELEQALAGTNLRLAALYEVILVLAGRGDLALVQDDAVQAAAGKQTERLNLYLFERARGSSDLQYLASPVIGSAVAASRFHQLFLLARRQGRKTSDDQARFAWDILDAQGQRVVKDNKPLESADDNLSELAVQAHEFNDKRLALLQALQVV